KVSVLKEVTFDVYKGEVIALLGKNGSGKSTLIKIMNNLLKEEAGELTLFGATPGKLDVRNRVGVMLQDNIILHRIKVKELLDLAGRIRTHRHTYLDLTGRGHLI